MIVKLSVVPTSDARQIERVLLACATQAELVMKHPAASVIFRGIGKDALDFELRCFVSDTDHYLPTLSALNFAIDAAMRGEGIQPIGAPTVSMQLTEALEEFAARRAIETA